MGKNLFLPLTLITFLLFVAGCSYLTDGVVAPWDRPFNFDWDVHLDSGMDPSTPDRVIPDWCVGVQTDDPACWVPPGE